MRPFGCHLSLGNLSRDFKNRFSVDVRQLLQALFSGFMDDIIFGYMNFF